jgi:hypothetical protein
MCAPAIIKTVASVIKPITDAVGITEKRKARTADGVEYTYEVNTAASVQDQEIARANAEQKAVEEAAARAEQERQARVAQGRTSIDDAFASFNDNYFSGIDKQAEQYARSDLDKQYQSQLGNLISTLARTGNIRSATRTRGIDALRDQYQSALGQVDAYGDNYADTARNSVQSSRNELYGMNDGSNPDAIATSASEKANALRSGGGGFSRLATLMIDPTQFMNSKPGAVAASGGGAGNPALFNQSRQSRGGGYTVG